jgi:hypothetical protein
MDNNEMVYKSLKTIGWLILDLFDSTRMKNN